MPKATPGGLGHVPVAVYSCAAETEAARDAERLARNYAHARHWHVAGSWADTDPGVPLEERPAWEALPGALSSGLIRGIVVGGASHVAANATRFAALSVLIRDRGGFLIEATSAHPHRTPGQHERRRILLVAASGWWHRGPVLTGTAT